MGSKIEKEPEFMKKFREDLTKDWTEEDWCRFEENRDRDVKIENVIRDIIGKANDLGWIFKAENLKDKEGNIVHADYPVMMISEVEKILIALFNPDEMNRINQWVAESKLRTPKNKMITKPQEEVKNGRRIS